MHDEKLGRTYRAGPLRVNQPFGPMPKGATILAHCHNFDHPTFAWAGALAVRLMKNVVVNAFGDYVSGEVAVEHVIRYGDQVDWILVPKGTWHEIVSLEDGSVYRCIYPHRAKQAISLDQRGTLAQPPYTKRDENGHLWEWVDETIIENPEGDDWVEAYR
jgi:hypothetical protein